MTIVLIATALFAIPHSTKTLPEYAGIIIQNARAERKKARKRKLQEVFIRLILSDKKTGKQEAILLFAAKECTDQAEVINRYNNYQIASKSARALPTYKKTSYEQAKILANRIMNNHFTLDQLRTTYTANEYLLKGSQRVSSGITATMLKQKYNSELDHKTDVFIKKLNPEVNAALKKITDQSPKYEICFNQSSWHYSPLELMQNCYQYLLKNDPNRYRWGFSWKCEEAFKQAKKLYKEYAETQRQQEQSKLLLKSFIQNNQATLGNKKQVIGLKTDAQLQSEFQKLLIDKEIDPTNIPSLISTKQ
jgi:hypothetical protein